MSEEDLRLLFSNTGGTVKAFKFFQYVSELHATPLPPPHPTNAYCCRRVVLSRDHKMALIQMSTVEEATQALIDLHNYNMGGNQHLRVSFSKSTI